MATFLLSAYFILFVTALMATAFIVFHITRYSLNKSFASVVVLIFLGITILLVAANASLFFTTPWNKVFSSIFS
jgi:hypothetical protein